MLRVQTQFFLHYINSIQREKYTETDVEKKCDLLSFFYFCTLFVGFYLIKLVLLCVDVCV